jgi:hypothetical protein
MSQPTSDTYFSGLSTAPPPAMAFRMDVSDSMFR